MAKSHDYGMSYSNRNQNRGTNSHGSRANSSKKQGNNYSRGNNSASKTKTDKKPTGTPKAPYNFVPLNDVVVPAPLADNVNAEEEQQAYKKFLTSTEKKYSGYFEVEVENITPLFINNGKDSFFKDGKNYLIPGSSLRGAIKNYFKIITNGTMRTGDDGDITDKYLYYRSFDSPFKPLKKAYTDEMTAINDKGKNVQYSNGGFLVRQGKEYFICPASFECIEDKFKAQRIYNVIEWNNTEVNVFTGKIDKKKYYYKFTGAEWNTKLTIPEKVLASYRDDKNAKGIRLLDNKEKSKTGSNGSSLLRGAETYNYIIPCFYVADGSTVRHFGSGPFYRIPYTKSIGEHIPTNINADKLDFTVAMFGNKDNWSSRVFFENLYLKDDKKASFENASEAIPLLGAKPTSFQNYLEPKLGRAAFWDEDTNIRGYKLYWHKKCDWRKDKNARNQNKKITKTIAPLKEGHTFIGRVRFENLSDVELGALAKVLSLGDNEKSAYKLGMGKPIGMGSIHLKAELYLQNDAYYTSLFTSNGFDNGLVLKDKQYYINIFQKYMSKKLQGKSMQLYEERMKELASIMAESHPNEAVWAEKTAYMSIDKDKDLTNQRILLLSITEVVKS